MYLHVKDAKKAENDLKDNPSYKPSGKSLLRLHFLAPLGEVAAMCFDFPCLTGFSSGQDFPPSEQERFAGFLCSNRKSSFTSHNSWWFLHLNHTSPLFLIHGLPPEAIFQLGFLALLSVIELG